MIIQCENCGKKFDLDESLLNNNGSRVRCSVCRHIFVAYPPEPVFLEEIEPLDLVSDEGDKTLIQDSLPFPDERAREARLKDRDMDFDDVFSEIPDLERTERAPISPPTRRGRSRAMLFFLVILLMLVGSGAAIIRWAPELIPGNLSFLKLTGKEGASDPGTRRLSFEDVNGDFVVSEKSGKRYVIRGKVINNYPKPRSFIRVKGAILDDHGRAAKIRVVYAGNTFNNEELKTLPMEEINGAMKKRHGMNRKNVNIGPGARVHFMIVFEELPDNMSEFEVMAVSSSPGV